MVCEICGKAQHPPDSDQLELEFVRETDEEIVVWRGKPPRELTRAFEMFSLGAQPPGGLRE